MKLNKLISQYIDFRKSLGSPFRNSGYMLKAFCREMGKNIEAEDVTEDSVRAFLACTGPMTRTWHQRHCTLNVFYRYAISRGYIKKSPLPVNLPKLPPAFVPYIYTHKELHHLLDAVFTFQVTHKPLIVPTVIHALLLLLYGTGLRISEALSLTIGDADLTMSVLTIRESKFFKTRLVPMGPQLASEMRKYAEWRKKEGFSQSQKAPFFISRHGAPLNKNTISNMFRRICNKTGIKRTDGARYQPRLHDLRHSFAVNRLIEWYRQGEDVQKMLPYLSVYMGHICLISTSRYLTMTPELLNEANKLFEDYALKGGRDEK